MEPGRFRHRITLQVFREVGRLDSGQPDQQWVDVATVSAEVKAISGRELIASGAELSEATVRIWMRYRPDVDTAARILFRGDIHDIQAVLPDARFTRLELLCKQGVKRD
ncbi:TPA: phage head closure protein [Yersinia enterocolitica]|uniref:Phage head closure protein n=2 Tax=Yersinia TaxID=629 RepID=A0AAD2V3D8_YEREN|nr:MULTISPECIES: phage head closure protein [Yersinia]EKN3563013.1 phage head closure protein [Yersinia enterocolitica]EKN4831610.1 phage head closure protein [Yersinia enterocolitica]EKN6067669.1 head-tail adaptor [Yersinia enterocolitica]EKN6097982.1 head-tail adaptor [Yersinia enterocolitica]EKN6263157.1 head-tail adaptor [Yersinia enterocolitica]